MGRFKKLITEIHQRSVWQALVVYLGASYAVLEAAALFRDEFGLPGWLLPVALVLLLIGLPVVVVISLAREEVYGDDVAAANAGVAAAEDRRLRMLTWRTAGLSLLGAMALWGVIAAGLLLTGAYEPATASKRYLSPAASDRVAVRPFENLSGDPELALLGRVAAHRITEGLNRTGLVEVISVRDIDASLRYLTTETEALEGPEWLMALAEETGAGLVISGEYYELGDSVYCQARLNDAQRGEVVLATPPVSAPAVAPLGAVDSITERLMTALGSRLNPRLRDMPQSLGNTSSYKAYSEYILGLELHIGGDHAAAIEHLYRAVALDSSFKSPLLTAASAHINLGQWAKADSLIQIVGEATGYLSPWERAFLRSWEAILRGDLLGSQRAVREAAVHAPASTYLAYQQAWGALPINYPREAVDVLEQVDPGRGLMRGWWPYWRILTGGYHMLGDYRRELSAVRQARQQSPDVLALCWVELRALSALGRLEDVRRLLDESLARPYERNWTRRILVTPGIELRSHGYVEASREFMQFAIDWYRDLPPAEANALDKRSGLARTLYAAKRWDEARPLFERLTEEYPDNITFLGYSGLVAARSGDRGRALQVSDRLAGLEDPYLFGQNTYWRASIAAALGERERAVKLLRQAFGEGEWYSRIILHYYWNSQIDFESLQNYPPFQELMRPKG